MYIHPEVIIVLTFSILLLTASLVFVAYRRGRAKHPMPTTGHNPDVQDLKQRLQVLERIAVEKEDTLSREIEELRAASR